MLQTPNAAAQLVVDPLFWCGVLCFKGRIRVDVLRRFLGPKDFFRKQIKAGENKEGLKRGITHESKKQVKEKTHSRMVRFLGVLSSLMGRLPLSMALGFSVLEQGRRCEVMDECASGFAGHPRGLF
jgi:hypothetical protein